MIIKKYCLLFAFLFFSFVVETIFSAENASIMIEKKKKQRTKVIGVIGDYLLNKDNKHNFTGWPIYAMRYQYIDNFVKVCKNKNVSFVMLTCTPEQADKVSNSVDAIVLTGGDDDLIGRRDEFEKRMVLNMIKQKKQVFGICRGMQMVNVFLGGDMVKISDKYKDKKHLQHKTASYCKECDKPVHKVKLNKGSLIEKILKKDEIMVNSNHNDTIDKLGTNIVITGVAPDDNMPEVVEIKNYPKFFLTVQWHPEFLSTKDDEKLIEAFCDSVEKNL